jgi:hypothetical protein
MITKQELIEENKRLKKRIEDLEFDFNNLNDLYSEMENKYAEVQNEFDSLEGIYDVEWFKFKLASDNLLTPELEDFIRQYLRFYNERK